MALLPPEWLQNEVAPRGSTRVVRFADLPPVPFEGGTVVAAGGWCAPPSPLYDLFTWGAASGWVHEREQNLAALAEWAGDLLERAQAVPHYHWDDDDNAAEQSPCYELHEATSGDDDRLPGWDVYR